MFIAKAAQDVARTLLFNDKLRFHYCRLRWRMKKRSVKIASVMADSVGKETVEYNLSAFNHDAAFGMARRMSLLIFPIAAALKDNLRGAHVLIVGARTEDDIFWARSVGLRNAIGFDLFSYSELILVGDIHNSNLPTASFDAVILGWMISYTNDPAAVVKECRRLIKPGGYLGIGIEANAPSDVSNSPRQNSLNSARDLIDLVGSPVVFSNESFDAKTYDCGVVFRILPSDVCV